MSVLIVVCGSASKSSQLHLPSREQFSCRAKGQSSSLICGVGPAERTGKSVVTYCPGGSRFSGVCSGRLDLKPREIVVESMEITLSLGVCRSCQNLTPLPVPILPIVLTAADCLFTT